MTTMMACGPVATGPAAAPIAQAPTPPGVMEGVLPFWGHQSSVGALVFSSDGQVLYSAAAEEGVIAWNTATGQALRRYRGKVGATLTGLLVDPKGAYVALADDRNITFWSARNGMLERTIELPQSDRPDEKNIAITTVVPAANSDFLLVGDNLGRMVVVGIAQGTASATYRTPVGPVRSIAAGATWAAVAGDHHTVVIDLKSPPVPLPVLGELEGLGLRQMTVLDGSVAATDGSNIILWGPKFREAARAIAGDDVDLLAVDATRQVAVTVVVETGLLSSWDLKKKRRQEVAHPAGRLPAVAALDPVSEVLATSEFDAIVLRRMKDGSIVHRMPHAVVPHFTMFEPGTHRFLAAGRDGRPVRYDLDAPGTLAPFKGLSGPIVDGALDLESNGFYATTDAGEIVVFDYQKGLVAKELAVRVGARPHIDLAKSRMAIASEERGLVTSEGKGELVIWDLNKDVALARLNVTDVVDVAFAPAGPKVYYAGRSAVLEAWNFEDQSRKKAYDDLNTRANALRMAPGGTMLALCGDRGVTFFNPALEPLFSARLADVRDIAFASDGTRAAVSTQERSVYLIVFEGNQVRSVPVVQVPTAVTSLSISSDNRFLLIGEQRGVVSAFDLTRPSTSPSVSLQVVDDARWLAFTPDGRWVGTAGDDVRFDVDGEVVANIGGGVRWMRDEGGVAAALR